MVYIQGKGAPVAIIRIPIILEINGELRRGFRHGGLRPSLKPRHDGDHLVRRDRLCHLDGLPGLHRPYSLLQAGIPFVSDFAYRGRHDRHAEKHRQQKSQELTYMLTLQDNQVNILIRG